MATTVSEPRLDGRFDPETPRLRAAVNARRLFVIGGILLPLSTAVKAFLATALRGWRAAWQSIQAVVAELNLQLSGEYERRAELAAVPVRRHG